MLQRKSILAICEWCGEQYKRKKRKQRFCSRGCSGKWGMISYYKENPSSRRKHSEKMKEYYKDPIAHQKLSEGHKRFCRENPERSLEIRKAASRKMKNMIKGGLIKGGCEREIPKPQMILGTVLGWDLEHIVPLGKRKKCQKPYYAIDIANPLLKLGVEVDGRSHRDLKVRSTDKKRDLKLQEFGWKILRFTNKEVLTNLPSVVLGIQKQMGDMGISRSAILR